MSASPCLDLDVLRGDLVVYNKLVGQLPAGLSLSLKPSPVPSVALPFEQYSPSLYGGDVVMPALP